MYQKVSYFKGLNGLRFMAAWLVVLHHAEQIRLKYGLFNLKEFSLFNNGGLAVSFFFVLSGFLITYLLLKEIKERKTVSVKSFYARRVLRIWPLYFLLVAIGTLILPSFLSALNFPYEFPYQFSDVIAYYVFFSPFMVNILYGSSLLEPLWSIGVEEIFYIAWAPLFKFFNKYVLPLILGVIALRLLFLFLLPYFSLPIVVVELIEVLQFEAMAIGGLAAYLVYHTNNKLESYWIFSKVAQAVVVCFVLLRIFAFKWLSVHNVAFEVLFTTPILSNLVLVLSFAYIIVNTAINKNSFLKLDHNVFNFLGNISYGIYMYHMLVVFALILFLKKYLINMGDLSATLLFYCLLTFGVITVSYLSKRFFEDPFLRLKSKFRTKVEQTEHTKAAQKGLS